MTMRAPPFVRSLLATAIALSSMLAIGCSSANTSPTSTGPSDDTTVGDVGGKDKSSPLWSLQDFNPKSGPLYMTKYGPKDLRGKVLVVILVAGWCPYCQAQVGRMEALKRDLEGTGKVLNIVGINDIDAVSTQNELTSRTGIPLFQDATMANGTTIDTAWDLLGGKKDDIYIYDSKGVFAAHFQTGGGVEINITTTEGYANVRDAISIVN